MPRPQRQFHGLRPEGQHRRFRLDPDQWPESGHHPTTRPGTASPRRRSDSTRVTRASSARTDRAVARTARRDARAPYARRPAPQGEKCGVGTVPPVIAADDRGWREGRPARAHQRRVAHVTASAPTAARRPARGYRPSGRVARRTRRRHAPSGRTRPIGIAPPRAASAAPPRAGGGPRPPRWIAAPCATTMRTVRRALRRCRHRRTRCGPRGR